MAPVVLFPVVVREPNAQCFSPRGGHDAGNVLMAKPLAHVFPLLVAELGVPGGRRHTRLQRRDKGLQPGARASVAYPDGSSWVASFHPHIRCKITVQFLTREYP
ncbi:hypothetical protein D3C72_2128010 [compost metagenome]